MELRRNVRDGVTCHKKKYARESGVLFTLIQDESKKKQIVDLLMGSIVPEAMVGSYSAF